MFDLTIFYRDLFKIRSFTNLSFVERLIRELLCNLSTLLSYPLSFESGQNSARQQKSTCLEIRLDAPTCYEPTPWWNISNLPKHHFSLTLLPFLLPYTFTPAPVLFPTLPPQMSNRPESSALIKNSQLLANQKRVLRQPGDQGYKHHRPTA